MAALGEPHGWSRPRPPPPRGSTAVSLTPWSQIGQPAICDAEPLAKGCSTLRTPMERSANTEPEPKSTVGAEDVPIMHCSRGSWWTSRSFFLRGRAGCFSLARLIERWYKERGETSIKYSDWRYGTVCRCGRACRCIALRVRCAQDAQFLHRSRCGGWQRRYKEWDFDRRRERDEVRGT